LVARHQKPRKECVLCYGNSGVNGKNRKLKKSGVDRKETYK
jgi:hypothetical protein